MRTPEIAALITVICAVATSLRADSASLTDVKIVCRRRAGNATWPMNWSRATARSSPPTSTPAPHAASHGDSDRRLPRDRCDRGRRVRTRLHRYPVRHPLHLVHSTQYSALAPRDRRADRFEQPRSPGTGVAAGHPVTARSTPCSTSGAGGDAHQATQQGRYLGGRPPYGYSLVGAGPHPNAANARWGRRLQRLAPDPRTAPHVVTWIFRQRLAGHSVASIARRLNERGVPCPSSADPDRNQHRTRGAWTLRAVAVILANPRYTGRQTWNRRATDTSGPAVTPAQSAKAAHRALVTEQDFIAAQQIRAARPAHDGRTRRFALAGLIHCGVCDRRLDSHWNHGRPTYRAATVTTAPNARTKGERRRSTSTRTISSTRSASGSEMRATSAMPHRSLTEYDTDAWQQRCASQERSSSMTAPDGDWKRSIPARLRTPTLQDRVSRSVG